ncbi:MAG: YitT family protein [Clostridia bacterium]|nr:YitT family protein [Clostridia bacterium]
MKKKASPVETESVSVDVNANEKPEISAEAAANAEAETKTIGETAVSAGGVLTQPVQPKVYGDKVLSVKEKRKRAVLNWIFMTFGIILMSFSVYFFQTPNDFTLGGIAGIAVIINSFIPAPVNQILTQGVIMAIINVALLIIGLIILGKQCTIRTIFCSLFYTGFIWLFEYFDVIGLINTAAGRVETVINPETGEEITRALRALSDEPFLELVYAILLFGIGGAIVFNCGASSGGTDIIALILKKFTNLNVGMALMIIDMVIVLISFYTFTVDKGLFSVLGLFTKSFLLDSVIESFGKTKYITIITKNHEIISDYILKVINHGFTMYDAQGGYTGEPKKVLVTVCKRSEALKLKIKIHEVDPSAFVIITDANEILGKGFGGTI